MVVTIDFFFCKMHILLKVWYIGGCTLHSSCSRDIKRIMFFIKTNKNGKEGFLKAFFSTPPHDANLSSKYLKYKKEKRAKQKKEKLKKRELWAFSGFLWCIRGSDTPWEAVYGHEDRIGLRNYPPWTHNLPPLTELGNLGRILSPLCFSVFSSGKWK